MRSFHPVKNTSEDGFTLLELLLVIGVVSVLFLGITKITTGWVDSEVSSGAGQHLQRVSTVVQNYVEANGLQLTETDDALGAGGPWQGLKDNLAQEGLLTNNELRTPLNAPLKISFVIDNKIYRATIYTTNVLPYKRVVEAARETGNSGGTISAFPAPNFAFGAFGQWKVDVTKILPAGFTFPCVPAGGDACLIAMVSYSQDALCGPFLYHNDVESSGLCPGGNTMSTNLNMNGKNITNAGDLQADKMDVANQATIGAATVNGATTINGPLTSAGGMTVSNGMTVSGDTNVSGDVNMDGTLRAVDVDASTLQAPKIQSNQLNAQILNVKNGTVSVEKDFSVNGNVNLTGASGNSEIVAGTVNTGQINAEGGDIHVGTMNVENTLQVNGQMNITGSTIAVDQLVADQCMKIKQSDGTYKAYGNCI